MKNIFILFASLFLLAVMPSFSQKIVETQHFKNNPQLGGEVVINNSTKEVVGNTSYTTFEVNVPNSGSYFLSAWLIPSMLMDGTYTTYDVIVNGSKINGRIVPTHGDWQSIGLTTGRVSLHAGKNTIAIAGVPPVIPEVEFIKLSRNNAEINSESYDTYKAELQAENVPNRKLMKSSPVVPADPGWGQPLSPLDTLRRMPEPVSVYKTAPKNFIYVPNLKVRYTFYTMVNFTRGQQISITATGTNSFRHILELFSSTNAENFSWVTYSNAGGTATLNVTIAQSGLYYVRLRSGKNGAGGQCNLNINNQFVYEGVPIYSMGVSCSQDTENIYNTFTTQSTGDPRIWIEEGSSIPGKITAYNDDYSGSGDFNWGRNSRVKKQFPRPVHAVQISAYGSNDPVGTCNLYVRCMNSDIAYYFENLKADDAIQSAPVDPSYNCISYSSGIWDYWEWPDYIFSEYYVPNNPLASFDNFYKAERFPGCSKYSRNGATESNSILDLWAIRNGTQKDYTHASVTNGADNFPHGYDWESKPGQLMRTFHPRYALSGRSYGEVVEHYRCTERGISLRYPIYASISSGDAVLEHVGFTSSEEDIIDSGKAQLTNDQITIFNLFFNELNRIWAASPYSNPKMLKKDGNYNSLLNFCRSVPSSLYLVYEKLGKGELLAIQLINDITLENNVSNNNVLNTIKISNANMTCTSSGAKIVRSPYSNCMLYAKQLLAGTNLARTTAKQAKAQSEPTGISYSNSDSFNVSYIDNEVTIDFQLPNDSQISIHIFDYSGNIIETLYNNHAFASGSYHYTTTISSPGIYFVRLLVNGNVNVKKVMIK